MSDSASSRGPVVIFDGTCGFCNRLVVFALKHDARGELIFTSNTTPFGTRLLSEFQLASLSKDTLIVVAEGQALVRSDAAIYIARHLRAPYRYCQYLRVIPRCIRDLGYRIVAGIRHRLASGIDVCALLPPEQQARIVEE